MRHEDRVAGLANGHESLLVKLAHHMEVELPEHVKRDRLESTYDKLNQYMLVLVKKPAEGK